MSNIFKLNNVKYKDILSIDSLVIKAGDIVSIIGKSGSGKSTLLLMLNKMISPEHGDIFYKDNNLKNIDSIVLRRKVVMLGQEPVIYDGNVRYNLNIGLEFSQNEIANDDDLKKVLHYLELDKNLDDDPSMFSGGEKQRIAMARFILMNPDVFLLDEPSSALDSNLANTTVSNIIDIAKKNNKTVIMVTHSKEIADNLSDKTIEIDSGRVIRYE